MRRERIYGPFISRSLGAPLRDLEVVLCGHSSTSEFSVDEAPRFGCAPRRDQGVNDGPDKPQPFLGREILNLSDNPFNAGLCHVPPSR